KDEYVDPLVRDRADACSAGVYRDHSLMGDFHQEGVARAELKGRHAAAIIRDLNVTLGRAFKAAVVADNAGLQAGNPAAAEPGRVPTARAGGPAVFSIQALREQARASAGHDFPEQDQSRRLRT
ncbi:MAG: hypothetical protein JO069_03285, partial [Verrucomicrobia bacterium]|nr:hypothetical protein [Verrucomicrobiota bacterium]